MSNTLTQALERARRHRMVTGSVAFLRWWRDELIDGLPELWRARLRTETERLFVASDGDEVTVRDNAGEILGTFRESEEPAISAQVVQGILGNLEEDHPEIYFLMDEARVLQRTLTLPAAAEDNLRQVMHYEMDRYTPFKADQVHFDCELVERLGGGTRLRVNLLVARRAEVEAAVRFCRERSLELHGIDVIGADGERRGVNLLPPELRAHKDRRQLKWNLALAGLFVILLYGVMWQSVASREEALEAYRMKLDRLRGDAAEVVELREELEESAEAARFLGDQKRRRTAVTGLLAELTRQLPENTWLQRLQVNEETVQISGQTPETAQLVALLEKSECLRSPNIKGAVTPDPQSGKERFTIEAMLVGGQC